MDYAATNFANYSYQYGGGAIAPYCLSPQLSGIQVFTLGAKDRPESESETSDGECVLPHSVKNPFAPECNVPLPFHCGDEYGYYGPTAVWKRNERERQRVRCVNEGYERLKNHLPFSDKDKRISKADTLNLAIKYIRHLERLLADDKHWQNCHCYDESENREPSNKKENKPKDNKRMRFA